MDSIAELAKMFKQRDNVTAQGVSVGTVLKIEPELKISINTFMIEKEDIVSTIALSSLKLNDSVVLMPSSDNQVYFLLGKVI